MQLFDALTLDAPRRSQDGYVRVRARSARAGVYDYLGAEVDPEGKRFRPGDVVKVYRPADQVFDRASLASFVMKPITDDHPTVPVNASNWRDHARGVIAGAVQDGEYVGFDLAFLDAATVDKLDSGKRELSNGYACDLSFEDGTAPDGTAYQAVQRNIRGNHIALVDRGRAGPECRVADASRFAPCDANPAALSGIPKENAVKKIVLDGLQVDLTDADAVAAAFTKLQDQATKAATELSAKVTEIATKDAEIATLKKAVEDAKLTPAALRDAAKAYANVCDKAKALGIAVADDADADAVMKAVVDAKMGDAAKDWTADQIAASFAVLTKDAKPADAKQNVVPIGRPVMADTAATRDAIRAARYL